MNLDAELTQLESAEFVRRLVEEEPAYLFKHTFTVEVAYESLLLKTRRKIHYRVAKIIEELYPEQLDQFAALLALHYDRAGEAERAVDYLLRVGDQAERISSYREAAAAFARALELIPESEAYRRATLLVKLGNVNFWLGENAIATSQLHRGLDLARANGDHKIAAIALIGLCNVREREGAFSEANQFGMEALMLARKTDHRAEMAWALRRLGASTALSGNNIDAKKFLQESLALSWELDDRSGSAACLALLGGVAAFEQDYSTAMRYLEQALEICREIGDRRGLAITLSDLGQVVHQLGDNVTAARYLREALGIAREIGERHRVAITTWNLGDVAAQQGDIAAAERYYREALAEAIAIDVLPITLTVIISVATLQTRTLHFKRAAELLGLVQSQLPSAVEVKEKSVALLKDLRVVMSNAELDAAMQAGQAMNLDQVVKELLMEKVR